MHPTCEGRAEHWYVESGVLHAVCHFHSVHAISYAPHLLKVTDQ